MVVSGKFQISAALLSGRSERGALTGNWTAVVQPVA
jgi:hypothetical protein